MTAMTSRRSVLTASGVLAVGAVAVVGHARTDGQGPGGEAVKVVGSSGPPTTLVSRNVNIARPDRKPGRVSERGDVALPFGDLSSPDGQLVGRFETSHLVGSKPMHLQRVVLGDGMLVGLGAAGRDGVFTVVGASGKYAGASGAYTVTQVDDGDLEFCFDESKAI